MGPFRYVKIVKLTTALGGKEKLKVGFIIYHGTGPVWFKKKTDKIFKIFICNLSMYEQLGCGARQCAGLQQWLGSVSPYKWPSCRSAAVDHRESSTEHSLAAAEIGFMQNSWNKKVIISENFQLPNAEFLTSP